MNANFLLLGLAGDILKSMKFAATLFVIATVLSFLTLNPRVKTWTTRWFLESERNVLSQLDFEAKGVRYKIIKLLTLKGLSAEIYRYEKNGMTLVDQHLMKDKKDAYYNFGDEKHNLFFKDINQDGRAEIILPSIDKNMKARLNIFFFDPDLEKLQKVTKH